MNRLTSGPLRGLTTSVALVGGLLLAGSGEATAEFLFQTGFEAVLRFDVSRLNDFGGILGAGDAKFLRFDPTATPIIRVEVRSGLMGR
jgi:hypothetical protein